MTMSSSRRFAVGIIASAVALVLAGCGASSGSSAEGGPTPSALGGDSRMGAVQLVTDDLEGLRRFYTEGVGLAAISSDEQGARLGVGDEVLLELVSEESPDAAADDPAEAGLYHSAFLYSEATELASALVRTAGVAPGSFQGSADHRVSLAFYFADPDGNGVELYVDTPEDTWIWNDGIVTMGSEALDPNAFIDEHLGDAPPSASAGALSMGHVHLRGGDLEQAEAFYEDGIGFAVTQRADGAVFFAADGYHHHLAVNVWSSPGAGERPESLGLGEVTVLVPDSAELDAVAARLSEGGYGFQRDGSVLVVEDPWGTVVSVEVAS